MSGNIGTPKVVKRQEKYRQPDGPPPPKLLDPLYRQNLQQPEGVLIGSTQEIPIRPAPPIPRPATDINERIKTVLGKKYNEQSHTIEKPDYVCELNGEPNDCVVVANNYISVAETISKIPEYKGIQGVKTAVTQINRSIYDFNGKRTRDTRMAKLIDTLSGGGKRKSNKKIGTRKKQYKRK